MDVQAARRLLEEVINHATLEINSIKCQVVGVIAGQVAVYAHDHVGRKGTEFGELSKTPSLDSDDLAELEQLKAVLLDREQRRNALKHLLSLISEGNQEVLEVLGAELERFFDPEEEYLFLWAPHSEQPNEYVADYPYTE
jgi:hypothetical protein